MNLKKMKAALPSLSEYFSQHGRLTEEFMDQLGIMSIKNQALRQLPKDKRVLHQERAILLIANDSIEK
jgi:hypothetical protein